jgi:predicted nucleic acid-binding Zn finger protein
MKFMTQQQFKAREERAENETLVFTQNEDGDFRVYSPAYPGKSYVVSGSIEKPTCTCPDFEEHKNDPDWRCKHILAVLKHVEARDPTAAKSASYDDEERSAIQGENNPAQTTGDNDQAHGISEMLIKRSVSPDGRIDSLSVELHCNVGNRSATEIKACSENVLRLQREITSSFLKENGKKENGKNEKEQEAAQSKKNNGTDGSVPAQMLTIGGTQGNWGRRLFINFDVNGKTLRLYGNAKELAKYISYAGFPDLSERIAEGVTLNLPCRVITKPSEDGKYTNIVRVEPIEAFRSTRRPAK